MDGRKVAADLERSMWSWAGALLPLLQDVLGIVLGFFRRFLLALLGGVPAENQREPPKAGEGDDKARQCEPEADIRPESGVAGKPVLVPRWRERVVRDCLRRIGEGLPLRERHLVQLPADVREWLGSLLPEEADAIKHLPDKALRNEFLLGTIADEMRGMTPMDGHPVTQNRESESEVNGPRRANGP